jgi:hypothetical protein
MLRYIASNNAICLYINQTTGNPQQQERTYLGIGSSKEHMQMKKTEKKLDIMNTAKLIFAIVLGTTSGVLMGFILSPMTKRGKKNKDGSSARSGS